MRYDTLPSLNLTEHNHRTTMSYHTLPCLRIILLRLAPFHFAVATRCSELFCYATAKLLSGKPLRHQTSQDTSSRKTIPCIASAEPYITIAELHSNMPSQNPAPQHHTLPLLDCASPLLNATSPRFAFATQSSLFYALAKPYPTQLDRNMHCLCHTLRSALCLRYSLPHHALPLLH